MAQIKERAAASPVNPSFLSTIIESEFPSLIKKFDYQVIY